MRRVVLYRFGYPLKFRKRFEKSRRFIPTLLISLGLVGILQYVLVFADTATTVPYADTFGTTDSLTVTGWDETNPAEIAGTASDSDTTRDGTATNKFAKLGNSGGWIRRTINATGYAGLQLKYYYRNDSDAGSNDKGVVQYCASSSCSSGYQDLASHNLDPSNNNSDTWSTQQTINLPGSLDNTSFRIRFINNANSSGEDFRIDQVEVTGILAPTWPTGWTMPNACVADPSGDKSPDDIDLTGTAGTPAVGFYSDANYQYFRERVDGNPGEAGDFSQFAWVVMLQTALPQYQYLASLNGVGEKVQLWQNTVPAGPVDFSPILNDPAETLVWEGSSESFARSVNAGGGIYYVDWAIPLSELTSRGITTSTTKFFATSANANNFNKDHLNCYEALTDVSITKADNVDPITSGGTETYTLTITNNGPDTATDVVVTDTLPAGFTPTSVTPSIGSCSDTTAPSLQCELGSMTNNASATISVVGILVGNGTVTNTTSVTSTTLDTNIANNGDSEDTAINPAVGSVSVQKQVDGDGNGTYEGGNTEANTLGFDWGLDRDSVNNDMGTTLSSILAGAHTVTENSVSGYHFVGWYPTGNEQYSCTSPQATSLPVSINVVNAQTTSITFCNARDTGTLKLIKNIVFDNGGTADTSDFSLYVKQNGVDVTGSPAAGSDTGTVYTLPTGDYTVGEESPPSGYEQTSINCDNQETNTASVAKDLEVVCTITNDDIQPKLTLVKHLPNDNGGTATQDDFTVSIGQSQASWGENSVNAGAYTLSESTLPGYTSSSWGSDCTADGNINLLPGDEKSCEITNDDVAPTITLIKEVINNSGGSAGVNDFGLTVGGSAVNSGDTTDVNANTPIALDEAGLAGYDFVSITGDENCPAVLGGTVTLNEGENITCTITNDDNAPSLTLLKTVTNNNGGTAVAADWTLTATGTDESPTNLSGTTPVSSDGTFKADTYTLGESGGPSGYSASSWTCTNEVAVTNGQITLANGQTTVCTITNDDVAPTITLIKEVINNSGGSAGVNDFGLTVGGSAVNSGDTTDVNANTPIALDEAGLAGYDFVSITGDENCPAVLGGTVTLNEGENITCTITNDDKSSTVIVTKYHDQDEDRTFNNGEPVLEGWRINLANQGSQTTDSAGNVTFSGMSAGSQQLSEDQQEGWVLSNISCDGVEGNLDGNTYYFDLGNGRTIHCYIGNHRTPVLFVTKTNDKPAPTTAGDTVTYTITVTVPDVSQSGRVYGSYDSDSNYLPVVTTDLPPNNFIYVAGSWTASSNFRGDLKAVGITLDPNYASPGSWILTSPSSNYLLPGEVVMLNYQAVIGASVLPGTYPDQAYVLGYNVNGSSVLGLAIDSQCGNNGQYAISCVSIISSGRVLGISTTNNSQPKVLGTSTTLADTGNGLVESLIAAVIMLATIGVAAYGRIIRKQT